MKSSPSISARTMSLDVSDGSTMQAFVADPGDGGNRNGILVFQEAFGVNAHIRSVCERFAREGYVAVAPELFHRTAAGFEAPYGNFDPVRPHVNALTPESMAADIRAAYGWLLEHSNGAVASVGFCLGGSVSFLANATVPLRAAVSFYGGRIAGMLHLTPSLSAPMMCIWGGKDPHIPPATIRAITDALRAAGKDHTIVEFSEAEHGFFCDIGPRYHEQSARQAWPMVLEFLRIQLPP